MTHFGTAGPCHPGLHYLLSPAVRLRGARDLTDAGGGLVVAHAPRQLGMSTSLHALARDLTTGGTHVAAHVLCGLTLATDEKPERADEEILGSIRFSVPGSCPPGTRLRDGLAAWAASCSVPAVLLLDEFLCLPDAAAGSVLEQIGEGLAGPSPFPTVILAGRRDLREIWDVPSLLGCPKTAAIVEQAGSVTLANFTRDEIAALYQMHTERTGQRFTSRAVDRVAEYTDGQPWLVNALADESTARTKPSAAITAGHIDEAKDGLIGTGKTHVDSLRRRLRQPTIRAALEPLLTGSPAPSGPEYDDSVEWARAIGLIPVSGPVRIANPIYGQIIPRSLASDLEWGIPELPDPCLLPDGQLDVTALVTAFTAFLADYETRHSVLLRESDYALLFAACLQRVIGEDTIVDYEYGAGRGALGIHVREANGSARPQSPDQRTAIELMVRQPGEATTPDGLPDMDELARLDQSLSRLGLDTGTLIFIGRRPGRDAAAEISHAITPGERVVQVFHA